MRPASLLALLLLPSLASAASLPLLADFDRGLNALGGSVAGLQAQLSLVEASDYSGSGASLRIVALGDQAQALLPLAAEGLDLGMLSSSHSVVIIWKAEAPGSECRVCLEGGTVLGELCATLRASDSGWHETSLALPPTDQASGFAGALPQPQGLKAAALGCSNAQVRAARRLGLPELATWTLLRLSQRCGVSPAALAAERSTRSWGEISQAHGVEWGTLMEDVSQHGAAASITPPQGSPTQQLKVQDNHAFEVRP
jgi:hypothetical protein